MILQFSTWVIIYLLELSVRLELTTVVYKTTALPVKLRKRIQELKSLPRIRGLISILCLSSTSNTIPEYCIDKDLHLI